MKTKHLVCVEFIVWAEDLCEAQELVEEDLAYMLDIGNFDDHIFNVTTVGEVEAL